MKKNLFLTFCFSFIPGAGQMYQNYMKRGVSIMIVFALFCALAIISSTPIFAFSLPIVYAYSFFDTYNIRNKKNDDEEPKDELIWESFGLPKIFNESKNSKKNVLLGFALILFGVYLIFNSVLGSLASYFDIYILDTIVNVVLRYLPPVIIATVSIVFGMKFITKK
ncbi:MAG: hypothetical protein RSE00_03230 [Clostridia bacterium]